MRDGETRRIRSGSTAPTTDVLTGLELKKELADLRAAFEELEAEKNGLEDQMILTQAAAFDQLQDLNKLEKDYAEEKQAHEQDRQQLEKFLRQTEVFKRVLVNLQTKGETTFHYLDENGQALVGPAVANRAAGSCHAALPRFRSATPAPRSSYVPLLSLLLLLLLCVCVS
jgi:hypothetical protein